MKDSVGFGPAVLEKGIVMRVDLAVVGLMLSVGVAGTAMAEVSCRGDYSRSLQSIGDSSEAALEAKVNEFDINYFYNGILFPNVESGSSVFGTREYPNYDEFTWEYVGSPAFNVTLEGSDLSLTIGSGRSAKVRKFTNIEPGQKYSVISIINPVVTDCSIVPQSSNCNGHNNSLRYTSYSFARIQCTPL